MAILKFVLLLFYLIILILNLKKRKRIFVYSGFLFLVFIVGNFKRDLNITSLNYSYQFTLNINYFYFIKYLYPFFFIGVFSLIKNKQETINRYFEILEAILIANVFFVFFGFIFSIDFFQSYLHSNRFGYSGLIEPGFFEFLLMIVISRRLFLDKVDFKLILLCIVSLFIGTKAVILFFGILIFYYLYEKRKIKLLFLYSCLLFSALVSIKPIVALFAKKFSFWQPFLTKYGCLTVITSTRDWNVQKTMEYAKENGTLKNLFVGGGELSKHFVEMDFVDLFLFFGIIGVIIYIMFLSNIINKKYHLIPFIVAFFSGDFLTSTIIISTCFIWMYESHTEGKGLFLNNAFIEKIV
ncbi:MAG: O-antigen ligase family protein [Flavobacterium sp.]